MILAKQAVMTGFEAGSHIDVPEVQYQVDIFQITRKVTTGSLQLRANL